jgi:hypothetical protein
MLTQRLRILHERYTLTEKLSDGANGDVARSRPTKAVRYAEEIAERASRGEDVSGHFTNKFTVVRPIRRVNVDLTEGMLRGLDQRPRGRTSVGRR